MAAIASVAADRHEPHPPRGRQTQQRPPHQRERGEVHRPRQFGGDPDSAATILEAVRQHTPDGIVCDNDRHAAIIMRHLLNANIAIPGQIKLAGFDDTPTASLLTVPPAQPAFVAAPDEPAPPSDRSGGIVPVGGRAFVDIADVQDGLGGEQLRLLEQALLVFILRYGQTRGLPLAQQSKRFAEDRFKAKKGAILKPVTPALFNDLGDDWAKYRQAYDPKGKTDKADEARVIEFAKLVTAADAPWLDRLAASGGNRAASPTTRADFL